MRQIAVRDYRQTDFAPSLCRDVAVWCSDQREKIDDEVYVCEIPDQGLLYSG